MTPKNNLSVLPWYSSLDEQNARKWWIYGRVYPLFTRAGYLLPFQIMREHTFVPGQIVSVDDYDTGYIDENGVWVQGSGNNYGVSAYEDVSANWLYFVNMPRPYSGGVMAAAFDENRDLLGTFNPPVFDNTFSGVWELPAGTHRVLVQTYNANASDAAGDVHTVELLQPTLLEIYTKDDVLVGNYTATALQLGLVAVERQGYDVIVFPADFKIAQEMDNGQYYAKLSDGVHTWYSEIFTVVNDIEPYLKIEWWDVEDFVMDAGTIVYKSPSFRNVVYLPSDIAKPEYVFEEEGETRDGYFFPIKQISEKRYRFNFLAPEYLLDVMRFIRMSDHIIVRYKGETYKVDSFLITPEWEAQGDVAAVEAVFDTDTVAKKICPAYARRQGGDFNSDFNNDF